MVRINFVTPAGDPVEVDANPGESVMEAAVRNGVDGIVAACGGCLSCATCHSYIDEPFLSKLEPQSGTEKDMLEYASHVEGNSRLTCQIEVSEALDGMTVRTPPSQD
jgi:ferredoxin, 2Fe-2S